MNLRSLAAGFVLALLLVASLGGVVCEADCAGADGSGHGSHACCPARSFGSSQPAAGNSAACEHPRREQASVDVAPVFAMPVAKTVATLTPVHFTVASVSRAISATASPPVFPLRI